MSSVHKIEYPVAAGPCQPDGAEEWPDHAANAQWLKDNPTAMPQVDGGRWTVYDRDGHLRGHLVSGGPTRDTRFKAISATDESSSPGQPPGYGITLHDAGAHLLDTPREW